MKYEQPRGPRDKQWQQIDYHRSIPVKYRADVAVIGGGIAGVCAAAAAARSGASVILVERFAVTGGVLTTGGVANFSGDTTGLGEVFDEILERLASCHALSPLRNSPHNTREQLFDHEILAYVLQELLLSRKVKLLLHTRFVDVISDNGHIEQAVVCGQSGPEAVEAEMFIDCTGEAQVAYAAGYATLKGRESDGQQFSMSMMSFVRQVEPNDLNDPVKNCWDDFTIQHMQNQFEDADIDAITSENDLPMVSIWPAGPCGRALKIKVPGYDSTDTESMTAAEIHGRRRFLQVVDYFQRVRKENWLLDHCSPIIGIRDGRRVVGDYVLTGEDVRSGCEFDDGVARGTWYLDAHSSDTDKRASEAERANRGVPPYQIPLRSLIARDSCNLLMAGRCLSADIVAQSSARVSPAGGMMGQAAGIAAAIAAEKGCSSRDVDAATVKQTVLARKANLTVGF